MKNVIAFVLKSKEADALAILDAQPSPGAGVQVSRLSDQQMVITAFCDAISSQISASAQATFDALLAAGCLLWVGTPPDMGQQASDVPGMVGFAASGS